VRREREVGRPLEDGAHRAPVWERIGEDNQLGRPFPRLTYTAADATGLTTLEPAPRTVRGARDLLSVALQYGNAFGQGFQAAALKPADFFGNDDVLYLMEDHGDGRDPPEHPLGVAPQEGPLSEADAETGARAGDPFTRIYSRGCWPRSTQSSALQGTVTFTTTRRTRRFRSPARSSIDT